MFIHNMQSIGSAALYPIVSLVLFFAMFIGVVIWALKADSGYIRRMEQLPLDTPSTKGPSR